MKTAADLSVEEQKTKLIEMQVENERKTAGAEDYALEKTLNPYKQFGIAAFNPLITADGIASNAPALKFL